MKVFAAIIAVSFVVLLAIQAAHAIDDHAGVPPILYYNPATGQKTPFVPRAWFVFGPGSGFYPAEIKASGGNTIIFAGIPDGLIQIDQVRERLDQLQSLNMKGIVMVRHNLLDGVNSSRPATYETLALLVNSLKDHPALLGWQLGDENPGSDPLTATDVINSAQVVRSLDPNRQIWQDFHNGHSNSTITAWMPGTDVVSFDQYTNDRGEPEHAGASEYLRTAHRYGQLAVQQGWAYAHITQGFGADLGPLASINKRFPTPDEYRWNVFAPIASTGSRGVENWVYANQPDWYSNPAEFDTFRDQAVKPTWLELAGLQHAMETGYNVGTVSLTWDGKGTESWSEPFDRFSQLLVYDDQQHLYSLILTNNASDIRQARATISNLPEELAGLQVIIPKTGQIFALTDLGNGSYLLADSLLDHQVVIYQFSAVPEPSACAAIGLLTMLAINLKKYRIS